MTRSSILTRAVIEMLEQRRLEDFVECCEGSPLANCFVEREPGNFVSPVTIAVLQDDFNLLDYILAQGGLDIDLQDPQGRTALIHSVNLQSYRACEMLLQAGAEPNVSDRTRHTPLLHAVTGMLANLSTYESRAIYPNIIGLLLMWGADPNCYYDKEQEITILYKLCTLDLSSARVRQPVLKVIRMLLAKGASPFLLDCEGRGVLDLPLHEAVKSALLKR